MIFFYCFTFSFENTFYYSINSRYKIFHLKGMHMNGQYSDLLKSLSYYQDTKVYGECASDLINILKY